MWQPDGFRARLSVTSVNTGLSYMCDIAGDYFECPPIVFNRINSDTLGRDAELTLMLGSEGRIVSPGEHDLFRISVDVTCEGTACGDLNSRYSNTFPCRSTGSSNTVAYNRTTTPGLVTTSLPTTQAIVTPAGGNGPAGSNAGSDDSSSDGGMIVSLLIGGIVLFVVVPILIYLVIKKRQVIIERNAFENPVYGQAEPGPSGDGNITYDAPEGYLDVCLTSF